MGLFRAQACCHRTGNGALEYERDSRGRACRRSEPSARYRAYTCDASARSAASARSVVRGTHVVDELNRPEWMNVPNADERLMEQVALQLEVQAKYTGYIDR